MNLIRLFFGCPMWQHKYWQQSPLLKRGESPLQSYSRYFNSVEGNTSFYQMPTSEQLQNWAAQTPESFSFTFKFPKTISHDALLNYVSDEALSSLSLFNTIGDQLGVVMLQLPEQFSHAHLSRLDTLFSLLPKNVNYGVEVRNMAFFEKGQFEQAFNQLLIKHNVNRIIMDTRGLFASEATLAPIVKEVQSKKPKVPTHVIDTADTPIVRFVGHHVLEQNRIYLRPWISKVLEWIEHGKQVYFFFHMPDNGDAPWLAKLFFNMLHDAAPSLGANSLPIYSLPDRQTQSQAGLF